MMRWSFPILALAVSVAACRERGEQVGAAEEEPAVDAAAVEQMIRGEIARWEQAVLAGDVAAATSFYADDAIVMPPGMAKVEGIDAVGAMYQQMFAGGNPTEVSLDPESIVVSESGDLAYELGTYSWTWPGPDGTPVTDSGKYVSILKPTETGEWKVAVDIWNQDEVPGAAIEMAPPPNE